MAKCLLFAYGLLKTDYSPPKTLIRHWPDAVRGLLYNLGPFPGATNVGAVDGWIEGEVLEIDDSELADLDEFEEVPKGKYVRKRTMTRGGHEAWIYEYNYTLPFGMKPIKSWDIGTGKS